MAKQQGLTIIELMIAVVLGLFSITVILGIVTATHRSFRQTGISAAMLENGLHAINILAEDLSMAGFWGYELEKNSLVSDSPSPGVDCGSVGGPPWLFNLSQPIESLIETDGAAAHARFQCIDKSEFYDLTSGGTATDVLAIKRTDDSAYRSQNARTGDDGKVFLRTDGLKAKLIVYDHTATEPDKTDWRYLTHIYYIRNKHVTGSLQTIPTLFRKQLQDSTDADHLHTDMLDGRGGVAAGVEYFHVMFGINVDGGRRAPNYYTSNLDADQHPAAVNAYIVTAQVYLLVRSETPDAGYINNRIYRLGDVCKNYSGSNTEDCTNTQQPDHFRRRVFSTTVKLRQPVKLTS